MRSPGCCAMAAEVAVKKAVRSVLGVMLAVGAAELYVRPIYTLSVTYEPGIGYVNAPGRARWGDEGMATSNWGPHGRRETPGSHDGAPVLVLGDSFTEGLMVGDDEVFPAVAQAALDRAGAGVSLVNVGRSGTSAADYAALAPRYRELWSPVWTVIELRSKNLAEESWDAGRTRFVQGPSGLTTTKAVMPLRTGLSGSVFTARQRTMLVGFGAVRYQRLRAAAAAEPALFQASKPKPKPPTPPVLPIEEELDALFDAYDKRVTILYISESGTQPNPIEDRTRAYCSRASRSCIFTKDAFGALRDRGHDPYGFSNTHVGVGHLNEHGHAEAGRLLAEELLRSRAEILRGAGQKD
jgi:hypothetical protein